MEIKNLSSVPTSVKREKQNIIKLNKGKYGDGGASFVKIIIANNIKVNREEVVKNILK